MTRYLLSAMLGVSLMGVPMMIGCDREVEHTESRDVKSDGTVVEKSKTISEGADGTLKKEESRTVDKP